MRNSSSMTKQRLPAMKADVSAMVYPPYPACPRWNFLAPRRIDGTNSFPLHKKKTEGGGFLGGSGCMALLGSGRSNRHYTPCVQCPLRRCSALRAFTADELSFVQ